MAGSDSSILAYDQGLQALSAEDRGIGFRYGKWLAENLLDPVCDGSASKQLGINISELPNSASATTVPVIEQNQKEIELLAALLIQQSNELGK
jgi:hypothetical protein